MTDYIQCKQDCGEIFLYMIDRVEISRAALEKYLAIIFKL